MDISLSELRELVMDREERYDCFFSLGGNDNQTTYFMIADSMERQSAVSVPVYA